MQPLRNLLSVELREYESWGSMADSVGSVPTRSMLTSSLGLDLGAKLGDFTPSLCAEYFLSSQITNPASVQNQNTSGQGYLLGVDLKWRHNSYWVAGSYLFIGQYQLSQETSLAQTSIFSQPSIYNLALGYDFARRFSLFATVRQSNYGTWTTGGNNTGDSVTQTTYGLGLSYKIY